MSTLAGQPIRTTYPRLLQVPAWGTGGAVALGDGTAVPLYVGPTGVKVGGPSGAATLEAFVSGAYRAVLNELSDLSAARLTGTLADSRLSANVPLKDAANTFTTSQTVVGTTTVRQTGGTPGTDELRLSFSSGTAAIQHMSGGFAIRRADGNTSLSLDSMGSASVSNNLTVGGNVFAISNVMIVDVNHLLSRPVAGQFRASRLDSNGSAAGLSFAGPSSTGTLRDVGLVQGGFATSTDATRQGTLSIGAYGIVSGVETLQTGLTVVARSSGSAEVVMFGGSATGDGREWLTLASRFASSNDRVGLAFVHGPTGASAYISQQNDGNFYLDARHGNHVFRGPGESLRLVLTSGISAFGTAVRTLSTTVASLPAASTAGAGARAFVTDANATTFASVVAGGGSNGVPVYSDGTDWRVG